MRKYNTLNQLDNEWIGDLRPSWQCCPTAHVSGLFQDGLFGQHQPEWLQPNTAERALVEMIGRQSSFGPVDLTEITGASGPAADELVPYLGKVGSCNATYIAISEIMHKSGGIPVKQLGDEHPDYYHNGTERLIERGGLNSEQLRPLLLDLRDTLGRYDYIVALTMPFPGGHYVNLIDICEDGLVIGDPYGLPDFAEGGYLNRNEKTRTYGTTYHIDYRQAAKWPLEIGKRIHVIRFE